MNEIETINSIVDIDNLENSLFEIYKILRPNAEKSKTIFKELKGGFINLSYVLYTENDIQNAIVFRTFGKKFNDEEFIKLNQKLQNSSLSDEPVKSSEHTFFNRTNEALVMHSISKHGLCEPVYAKYLNGMCFGYAQGITSSGPIMLTYDYLEDMSKKLAKFHSLKIEVPTLGFETHYEKMMSQFGPSMEPLVELLFQDVEKINEFPYDEFPKMKDLLSEEENFRLKLKEIGMGEICFCHNDLNQKNIIWDPQKRKLNFIDFEMSMNNYISMEIAYFFFSFSGHFLDDFVEEFLPSDEYRLKFIRSYLNEKYKLKNEKLDEISFENEVNNIFIRSNLFFLSHMVKITLMGPFFDFRPDFFKFDELNEDRKNTPYFCGRYGLKIYKSFIKIKNQLIKPFNEFKEQKL